MENLELKTKSILNEIAELDSVKALIDYYISREINIKASSKQTYNRAINLFYLWSDRQGVSAKDITRQTIAIWRDTLASEGKSAATIGLYITALRGFYSWIEEEGMGQNIAKNIKTPKKAKGFKKMHVPQALCTDMLTFAKDMGLRDYAIINLALRTGVRIGEIAKANIEDITFKGGQRILKVLGKGRSTKEDYIVLTDKAYKPIREYLAQRGPALPGAPLFISTSNNSNGKRLSTRTISDICKRAIKEGAGLDGREYTAHSLRHTAAVTMLNNGVSLYDIQQVLRHNSPTTTQIYLESVREERRLASPAEMAIDMAF